MNNPRLAKRYAKSLVTISMEMDRFDEIRGEVLFLQQIMTSSREFVVMLNSPVITSEKKFKVINAVTKGKMSDIMQTFLKLLTNKNRENTLPGIASSFLDQYNRINGLHNAILTTAAPISEKLVQSFVQKIKASSAIEHLTLQTKVDEKLIGGFILEMDGKLIDASILRDLTDVKKQFANNDYIHKLR